MNKTCVLYCTLKKDSSLSVIYGLSGFIMKSHLPLFSEYLAKECENY